MLPLSDGLPARRFPVVNVALIAANIAAGVAFFADVGGFVFGWVVARALLDAGRIRPQSVPRRRSALVPL